MNLFLVAWNLPKERHPLALAELRKMTEVYPNLDPDTCWHRSSTDDTAFVASMHTANQAATPRSYVAQSNRQVIFYDGLAVDGTGTFAAHRAEALSTNWGQLTEALEGQFVIIRVTYDPPCIELLTDFLGMEQVYYLQQGDTWLISNSVRLIERISKSNSLDPLGASLFLTIGWVGADRTLRDGIWVIPGGQYWMWRQGDTEPRQHSYYSPSNLARLPRRRLTRAHIERLADDMSQYLRTLGRDFGEIRSTLTGGRDSRLQAAMLIRNGIPARYHTGGDPASTDVVIATQIAKRFDLHHETYAITTSDVIKAWDEASWQLVRQNDGMVSLWQVADILAYPTNAANLGVCLWGAGGEIGRSYYSKPHLFLRKYTVADMQRFLVNKFGISHSELLRKEATALVRGYIQHFVEQCVEDGFDLFDVPDVFYTYERVRRWFGTNARKMMPAYDLFSNFCVRSFIEAAFALSPLQRYSEPLHYQLTYLLSPELHSLPFGGEPWRSQRPAVNLLSWQGTRVLNRVLSKVPYRIRRILSRTKHQRTSQVPVVFDQAAWLEAKRKQVRDICLDQSNSPIWNYVDRARFERIMSPTTEPAERFRYTLRLYTIATLFYYQVA